MKPRTVARDVVLLFVLTALGGLVVGLAAAAGGKQASLGVVAVSNIALSILGFAISGALTREGRVKHLTAVAFFVWVLSLTNLLLGFTFAQWLAGGIAIAFACAVGGGIAALLFRSNEGSA